MCETNEGTIRNCKVTGNLQLADEIHETAFMIENYGVLENCSIVGQNMKIRYGFAECNYGTIRNCNVTGTMNRWQGFLDDNEQTGYIENCTVNLNVKAQDESVYGFVSDNSGTITGCVVSGLFNTTCTQNVSTDTVPDRSIYGFVYYNVGTISDSYCDATLKYEKFATESIYGFAASNYGEIIRCNFSGKIKNAAGMVGFCGDNGYYNEPVGTIRDSYVKTDFVINNDEDTATLNQTDISVIGFCGGNSATISNCYVEGNISSDSNINGATGFSWYNDGTIENSHYKGNILLEKKGTAIGFVFYNENAGNVKNCYYEGAICVKVDGNACGLVLCNYGFISECYVKGALECTNDSNPSIESVGLLVGENWENGTIEKSMAVGKIKTINVGYVGGLVGMVSNCTDSTPKIRNSFANVEIEADKSNDKYGTVHTGGFIGCFSDKTDITNCYAVSDMKKNDNTMIAGFVGGIIVENPDIIKVNNSFYPNTYSGEVKFDVATAWYGSPQSIQSLRLPDTFKNSGWDMTNTWAINKDKNEGFPYLKVFEDVFTKSPKYTANVTVNGMGTVYPSGTFDVYAGENYDFRIVPQEGYTISDVTVNGISIGKDDYFSVTNVSSNLDVKVQLTALATISKKGTIVSYKDITTSDGIIPTGASFTVTSNEPQNPTVSFDGVSNKTAKAVNIPKSITYNGVTYKVTTVSIKSFTSSSDKAKYKVTDNRVDNLTVTYTAPTNKKKTKVTIPDYSTYKGIKFKVTKVSAKAFKNNKKLKQISIATSITDIGADAFSGCTNLKTVTIGKSLKTIGKNAFKNCKKLKKITIKSTKLKSVGKNALKGIHKNCKIIVPKSKLKKYKTLIKNKGQKKTVKITS